MNSLPTGTVTFLFTDIEGSTKLAQNAPEALPALLARHNAILHQAIEQHGGYVSQIIGDAFHAAFFTPRDALLAALDAQRMLLHEPWKPTAVRVRMGINTGAAEAGGTEERGGGYAGYLTLTRAERVMSLASGGQILLSNATAELVRGELPQGVTLRDLQEHRLKGLLNPERVWQVDAPDLPHEFPPLAAANAIPNNLPQQLTSFVGRERELAEIRELLLTTHLLTLTGSGGTGKTRLSLQTAAGVMDQFPDGVWFIELAPLTEPALVPQTAAATLGIRELPGHSARELLLDWAQAKRALLILDNCEHLIEASAQLANQLLRASPNLTILASSREALGIAGERAYRVPSLATMELRQSPTLDAIAHNDCARLFAERAAAAQAGFHLTAKNAAAIAQICVRLDGIPLAVELAAARVKAFPPEQIAARLDDRFRLLTGGSRTALPRQQTLRALIDWSYDLLPEVERMLLRRLAVFAGGWTFDAAEAVCAGNGIESAEILDLHAHLVDKSLVILDEAGEADPRYQMLETIRQYARDRLLDSGEMSRARERHLEYFLGFTNEAWDNYLGDRHVEWSRRVQAEQDNVRAALEWAMEHDPESAARLGAAAALYRARGGYGTAEGITWLEQALARIAALPSAAGDAARARQLNRARAQLGLGQLASSIGDMATSNQYAQSSLPTWREFGLWREQFVALMDIGVSNMFLGDVPTALAAADESVEIARALHAPLMLMYGLASQAMIYVRLERELDLARSFLQESLALSRASGDAQYTAFPLWCLGELESVAGNYAQARTHFAAALEASLVSGNRQEANRARSGVANSDWRLGHYDAALELFGEVTREWDRIGNRGAVARCLESIAFILLDRAAQAPTLADALPRAVTLLGAAEHVRQTSNSSMNPQEQAEYDEMLGRLRASTDNTLFRARWAEGRALTTAQAIAFAL